MVISGLVSATFKTLEIEKVLEIAKESNLKAIEWSENHHIEKGNLKMASYAKDLTKSYGLEIAGYGSYYRLGENMDIRDSLETAIALGAKNVRIWAGSKASSDLDEKEKIKLLTELKKATEIAKSMGLILNLEWHKNTLTDENQSGLDTLNYIDSPNLRTLWQCTQALGFDQRLEGLKMILNKLSYLHVYYWDERGRRPLEEGLLHWKKYLSILDKKKTYYALLEFVLNDSIEQFKSDAATLNSLLQGV